VSFSKVCNKYILKLLSKKYSLLKITFTKKKKEKVEQLLFLTVDFLCVDLSDLFNYESLYQK